MFTTKTNKLTSGAIPTLLGNLNWLSLCFGNNCQLGFVLNSESSIFY